MKKLQYTLLLILFISFIVTGCAETDNSPAHIGTWRYITSGLLYNLTIGETTWQMRVLDEVYLDTQDDSYTGTYVDNGDNSFTISYSQVYSSGWIDSSGTYDDIIFSVGSSTIQLAGDFGFGNRIWTFNEIE